MKAGELSGKLGDAIHARLGSVSFTIIFSENTLVIHWHPDKKRVLEAQVGLEFIHRQVEAGLSFEMIAEEVCKGLKTIYEKEVSKVKRCRKKRRRLKI